jgi:hypothetical protein
MSGVVELSLLEQADMLVSEGVGERVRGRGGDFGRRSRAGMMGGVVVVLPRGGALLVGEVGLVMSMTMSNAIRCTVWCFWSRRELLSAGIWG